MDTYADIVLMQRAHETGDWPASSAALRASFVREGELFLNKHPGACYLVVKVLRGVVVGWPTRRVGKDGAELEVVGELARVVACARVGLEKWHIVSKKVAPPLHWHLRGRSDMTGFRFLREEGPMQVIEWQARSGFHGVPELAFKALGEEAGAEIDQITAVTDLNFEDKMSLVLAMSFVPDLNREVLTT